MVISARVRVLVLSDAMTDAQPSVSTEDKPFMMAWCLAMRCTPKASTTVRMAGKPSGTAATASDTPSSSTGITSAALRTSDSIRMVPTTTTAITTTTSPSMRPVRATSCCNGVGCAGVASSMLAMALISVAMPVAATTARALPRATAVPLKTMFKRSPNATGWASVAASFSTASVMRPSAVTAFSALASCSRPRPAFSSTTTVMTRASTGQPARPTIHQAASRSPGVAAFAAQSSRAWQHRRLHSVRFRTCAGPFRTARGATKEQAFEFCTPVTEPPPRCGRNAQ